MQRAVAEAFAAGPRAEAIERSQDVRRRDIIEMQIAEEMEEIDRLMRVANLAPSKPGLFDAFELGLPAVWASRLPIVGPWRPPSSVLAADSVPLTPAWAA